MHINNRLTRFQEDQETVKPGSVAIQKYEGITEFGLRGKGYPWLTVRPNLQYIISGTSKVPNALVNDLETHLAF